MSFLRNCWYFAGWSHEVGAASVIGRQLLGRHIALFRRPDGAVAAIDDRCPHRFAPLSVGTVAGDTIICRYHGLAFGADGMCAANPHGPIPNNARVRSYPVQDVHRGLWIWMGEPALADPARIPDLSYLAEAPGTAFSSGYLHCDGHYELGVDNIMDLSHTDFLHPDTLGNAGITETKPVIEHGADHIDVTWNTPGGKPAPALASILAAGDAPTDVWQDVRWWAPGVMRLRAGAVAAGGRRQDGVEFVNCHIMTPETEKTTHYFFGSTRNFRQDDVALNERLAELRQRVFGTEDGPMIRLVQDRMGDDDFWDLKPVLLTVDIPPVQVRRALRRLIAEEQSSSAAAASAPL